MTNHRFSLRRVLAALIVCAATGSAQLTTVPRINAARVAGELGAATLGTVLGAEGGLVAAAGVAYLIRGHGGDVDDPRLMRALTPILWLGSGVGAGTGAWLASRTNGQSSNWGATAAASSVVSALAFQYAGWPMTPDSRARHRSDSKWRRLAPVWMTAIAATAVATATREKDVRVSVSYIH